MAKLNNSLHFLGDTNQSPQYFPNGIKIALNGWKKNLSSDKPVGF